MSGVFVNYRRNYRRPRDGEPELRAHAQVVEAIAERLARHFGAGMVFLDTELRLASRFPDELSDCLGHSDVVVAVIHQEWLTDLRERRTRQGADAQDWVHLELRTALASGIPLLPLLLDGARLPTRDELPDDIAELATFQAQRIGFGHWPRDMQRLIHAIERHVAAAPVQQVQSEPPVRQRRWYGLLAAGLIGLVTPFVVTGLVVEDPAIRMMWLAVLAAMMLLSLALLLGMASFVYLLRRPLDVFDCVLAERPLDEKTNVLIGLTVAGLAAIVLLTNEFFDTLLRALEVALITAWVITFGVKWIVDRKAALQWPQPRLVAHPAAIRGALARVAKHLAECETPLSRLQRDQARFALDQIGRSATRLRQLCEMNRRSWLRAASPWPAFLHAGWFAATVGAAAAAVLAYWESGGSHWVALAWSGGCLVLASTCYLATIDRIYRLQRWRGQVVVDAAPDVLEELEKRLLEISIPPVQKGPAA